MTGAILWRQDAKNFTPTLANIIVIILVTTLSIIIGGSILFAIRKQQQFKLKMAELEAPKKAKL